MYGGYYRADVDAHISILAVNTLYMNKKNNATTQGSEIPDMLAWMRAQLTEGRSTGRKFILTNHIYPGAKYDSKSKDLLTPESNEEYFGLLSEFRDNIVIEVCAHDHYADVRYHSSGNTTAKKFFFHNLIVSPGVTPIDGSNPGFGVFEVDATTFIPRNLELHFLPLEKTYGWKSIPTDISVFPFRRVELSQFGLTGLTAQDLSTFQNLLSFNDNLTYKYLVSKVGFNPADAIEFEQGMSLYVNDLQIITASKRKTYKFICQMHLSKDKAELDQCIADNKALATEGPIAAKFLSLQ